MSYNPWGCETYKNQNKMEVALTKCYFCGKDDKIIIPTRLTPKVNEQVKECHGKVIDMIPCKECEDWMKKGIILLGIVESKCDKDWNKEQMPNPYRSGAFAVVTEEGFKRIVNDKSMIEFAIKHRFMFIENEAGVKVGLWELN